MNIAAISAGAMAALVVGLGFAISMYRRKSRVGHGTGDDPKSMLYKLCRAHGNATEYVPILMIMTLYLGSQEPSFFLNAIFILAALSRYIHAAGLIYPVNMAKANPLRFSGALGTYISGFILAGAMIV